MPSTPGNADNLSPSFTSLTAQSSQKTTMNQVVVPVFVAADDNPDDPQDIPGDSASYASHGVKQDAPGKSRSKTPTEDPACNGSTPKESYDPGSNGDDIKRGSREAENSPPVSAGGAANHDALDEEPDTVPLQKKKRKRRKKASTGMPKNRGTGFEEFFADPPITPEEAIEERMIYSPDRPFADRIDECLNRYRSRRRLQGDLIRYFDEYLFLGGIDTQQRDFQGVDPQEYAAASAEEKLGLASVYGIHCPGDNPKFYSPAKPEHWSVDFTAVVAGYLSDGVRRVAWNSDRAEAETHRAIEVVANFLRYLVQHDVCNEYKDDITSALALCKRGKQELPLILKALHMVPCNFNRETAAIFEGGKKLRYVTFSERKAPMTEGDGIFACGVAFFGPPEVYRRLKELKFAHVVGKEPCSLEIVSLNPPDETSREVNSMYSGSCGADTGIDVGTVHCATIRCKHVTVLDDLCRGDAGQGAFAPPERYEDLLVDEKLLAVLRPGFIIRVTLAELNIGLKYMMNRPEILPGFYRFLPQAMMRYYKAPEPNRRPAPSALEPVEDDAVGGLGEDAEE